jgi:hypothetical protein
MGGPSSAVTAGLPLAMTFSRLLPLFIISTSKDLKENLGRRFSQMNADQCPAY